MTMLTYKEAYLLFLLKDLTKNTSIKHISTALLGLYTCDFLDFIYAKQKNDIPLSFDALPQWVDAYFLIPGDFWSGKNILFPVLETLETLQLIELQRQTIFNQFSLLHIVNASLQQKESKLTPSSFDDFIIHAIEDSHPLTKDFPVKKIIKTFNKKLLHCVRGDRSTRTHYEWRFFCPDLKMMEVCDCLGFLFNASSYDHFNVKETYILNGDGLNLKMDNDVLYVKRAIHDIHPISHFMKKKRVKIPFDIHRYPSLEISKERYVRKFDNHSKIELSLIHFLDQKWTTISVESAYLQIVLSLSLLINPLGGEKLSYAGFLKNYGRH